MAFVKHGMTALGAALLLGGGLAAPAQAGYTVTLAQVGSDVVATGVGSIDLAGLTLVSEGSAVVGMVPDIAEIVTGPTSLPSDDTYAGFTGPTSFGSGGFTVASSGSGDLVFLLGTPGLVGEPILSVPAGYVSGNPLSDTATYDNATFASLGATPGTYMWTWGTGADADSFTLQIEPAAVPEPSTIALLALPLGLVIWRTARRTRPAPGIG
jgi:hypothetical protein